MTTHEELHRKALLHDQAAELLRANAERHLADARRLRRAAARLKTKTIINKAWAGIERLFFNLSLRRLERSMAKDYDPDLSKRIDAVRYILEDRT
jgi:hypothetical protein